MYKITKELHSEVLATLIQFARREAQEMEGRILSANTTQLDRVANVDVSNIKYLATLMSKFILAEQEEDK